MDQKRVLIVEDDGDFAESLVLALSLKGVMADTAGSGGEGVEKYLQGNYAVAITDIKLPDFSGIEVIRRLKEARTQARVLAMTGFRDPELMEQARQVGALDVLLKPFRLAEFIDKVTSYSA